jgi:hypothetical protein
MAVALNSGPETARHQLFSIKIEGILTRSSFKIQILFSCLSSLTEVLIEIQSIGHDHGNIYRSDMSHWICAVKLT